jgi:outer membrane protein assembly factor BamB
MAGHGRPTTPHVIAADGYVEPRRASSGTAAGDLANKVRVVDAATLETLWSYKQEWLRLREVAWSEDDACLVCATDDAVLVLNAAGKSCFTQGVV